MQFPSHEATDSNAVEELGNSLRPVHDQGGNDHETWIGPPPLCVNLCLSLFESLESSDGLTPEDYEFVANAVFPFVLNEMMNLSEYPLIATLTNDKLTNNLKTVKEADTLNEQYIKEIFKKVVRKEENRAQAAEEILKSVNLGTVEKPKETQKVALFIKENILCRYGLPAEIISDYGSHFEGECERLLAEFRITRHKSSPYRPQTNGTVEAANKTLENIIRKMVVRGRDWPDKLHLALWGYKTSVRTVLVPGPEKRHF